MANNNKNRVPFSFNKAKDMYHKSDVVMGEMPPPLGKLFYMTTDDTTTGTASPDINQILSDDEAVKRMIKSVKLYKPH